MQMTPAGDRGDGRTLVEHAVRLLLSAGPPGWTQLHIECSPTGEVRAFVTVPGVAQPHSLTVPSEAAQGLNTYLHTTASPAAAPRQLVVDCFPDGRLSARMEPAPAFPAAAPAVAQRPGRQPWRKRLLAALTAIGLVAAAAIFAFGWRWSEPREADISLLPPPPQRQQQAFDAISQWFAALNARDTAAALQLVCPNPSGAVLNDIEALQGNYLGSFDYPEAIVDFHDNGGTAKTKVLLRVKPITELQRKAVEENQRDGSGLAHRWIVLDDDGGGWKVCGSE
ncbi:hypothetical protein O6P37_15855 [Mycobacterium sp. CPCC 205372]|uniref:DUF4878 domain-containing protein n=1 Tax=Mycobacterium hippophais TaxID=3016340 RepID=A0ABT4PUW2_9MYCO|nr:hypothetical protein [Mycobacterium hippophais]MCZ8380344.1 hypothetical protein [Mycobacterium hippophais]